MDYKSILVHVEPTVAAEGRVKCAADLADRFGAVLVGCGSETVPTLIGDGSYVPSGAMMAVMNERVDFHLEEAKTTFERLAGTRQKTWHSTRSMPDDALTLAARSADLIVTSRPVGGAHQPCRSEDPGLLVVISGRPVLITPPGKDHVSANRILVCWKECREARRALADALPLLRQADEVLVAEVCAPDGMREAFGRLDDVADGLRRHGVAVECDAIAKDDRDVADILQRRAASFGADLIVAGGYGRSRLGEWAFGGVTRSLLEQTERFVLLSH